MGEGVISTDEPEVELTPEVQKIANDLTNLNLRDFIARLEEQKIRLLLNIKDYKNTLEQAKEDQTDIYYYLNKKLDDNYELIASLETQILNEQADREISEKIFEKKVEELESKAASDEIKANSRINDLEEKLANLREFEDLKKEQDRKLQQLLDTLETERAKFTEATDAMELKTIRERDRMRVEQERVVKELRDKAKDDVLANLDGATLETWKENDRVKQELKYQSLQANEVLKLNKGVVERDRALRNELELAHGAEKEMMERLAEYQTLVKHLSEKCESVDQRVATEETRANHLQQLREREVAERDARIAELETTHSVNIRDEGAMWVYLRETYTKMMTAAGSSGDLSGLDDDGNVDRARILVNLFRMVLTKYPQKFRQLMRMVPKERVGSVEGTTSLPSLMSPSKLLKAAGSMDDDAGMMRLFHYDGPPNQGNSISGMQINTEDNPALDEASMLSGVEGDFQVGDGNTVAVDTVGQLSTFGQSVASERTFDMASLLQDSEGGMGQHSKVSLKPPAPTLKSSSTMTDEIGGGVARGRNLGVAKFQFNDSQASSGIKSQGTSYSRKMNKISKKHTLEDAERALGIKASQPIRSKPGQLRMPRRDLSPEADLHATKGLLQVVEVRRPGVRASHPHDVATANRVSSSKASSREVTPTLYIQQPATTLRSSTPGMPGGVGDLSQLGGIAGQGVPMSVNPVDLVRAIGGDDMSETVDADGLESIGAGSMGSPESSMTISPRNNDLASVDIMPTSVE
jgi:hypothetical protein